MGIKVYLFILVLNLFVPSGELAQDFAEVQLTDSVSLSLDVGSSEVRKSAAFLNRINTLKLAYGELKVVEIDTAFWIKRNGHVCCRSNLDLSLKRAERVKSFLVMNGIDSKRITCKDFSNEVKLVSETSEENKRKNMRVEVIFIKSVL